MTEQQPLVGLEPGGRATILSYNVPDPTRYSGRSYIDLDFGPGVFRDEVAAAPKRTSHASTSLTELTNRVRRAFDTGLADPELLPLARRRVPSGRSTASNRSINPETGETKGPTVDKPDKGGGTGGAGGTGGSGGGSGGGGGGGKGDDGAEEVAVHIQAGLNPVSVTSLWGAPGVVYVPTPARPEPRIVLVEEYRLSTYLGSFGAGRVVQTSTLLPGEKTTISVKTYLQSSETATSASSILDSYSEESSDDFESSIQSEQSDQETYEKNFEYQADASASASWGWGSASVSSGVSGGTNSTREEFAKNVSAATEKHATTASAKREVQVDTTSEVSVTSGEETSITREIANINVSCPLTHVFRQMNQEFVTILHLVDVRVAYFNGYAESKRERTLPELDALLDEVVVPAKRDTVRAAVLAALRGIQDWTGATAARFVTERRYQEADGSVTTRLQVDRDFVSEYADPATGSSFTVPGVILSVQKTTMRTPALIVEALLGVSPAIDSYNSSLQLEALHERQAANAALDLANAREQLAQEVVASGSTTKAQAFATVFGVAAADTASG